MVIHLFKNFLTETHEYRGAEVYWLQLWENLEPTAKSFFGWRTPWLHTGAPSILDGNPIFSAFSPTARRGIRIIQHAPTTEHPELAYWLDTFGGPITDPESIQELVIACALSDIVAAEVVPLLNAWVAGGFSGPFTGLSRSVLHPTRR
jgi:hypothetical protein